MKQNRSRKIWMWVGIILLIGVLIYWLFSIDILESMTGSINGN